MPQSKRSSQDLCPMQYPQPIFFYINTQIPMCVYTHIHTFMGSYRNSVRAGVLLDALQIVLIAKVIRSISLCTFQDVHCMNPARVFVRISWNVSVLHVCIYISALSHVYLQGVSIRGHLSEHAHHDLDVQTNGLALKALHCVLRPPLDLSSGVSFQQ